MLLSRTKENIKIHYKLVTGVTTPASFLSFFDFKRHPLVCVRV